MTRDYNAGDEILEIMKANTGNLSGIAAPTVMFHMMTSTEAKQRGLSEGQEYNGAPVVIKDD